MDIPFRGHSKSTVALMYILENVILKYISILDPIILFLFPISMFIFPNSELRLHDTKQRSDISDPPLSIFVARYFGLDGTYLNLSIFLDPLMYNTYK